jgi:hypothetical protein
MPLCVFGPLCAENEVRLGVLYFKPKIKGRGPFVEYNCFAFRGRTLAPAFCVLSRLQQQLEAGSLTPCDYAMAYILVSVSFCGQLTSGARSRRPAASISDNEVRGLGRLCCSPLVDAVQVPNARLRIVDLPDLILEEADMRRMQRTCPKGAPYSWRLVDVFRLMTVSNIPQYANECLVLWGESRRATACLCSQLMPVWGERGLCCRGENEFLVFVC